MINKRSLETLLKQNVMEIQFKKTNGEDRTMTCSLKQEYLPEPKNKTKESKKKNNENVLSVWDIEKNGFRSFRLNSIKNYQTLREGYEL
jgi:hypothetical protein